MSMTGVLCTVCGAQVYFSNKIASSLYPSFLSIRYSSRLVTDFGFRLRFLFKRTILLLILQLFRQFWYQRINKTSIYRIISNLPPNYCRNTRKTDKVYDFLQCANLTCVGNLSTQKRRSISQSPRATSVLRHLLTSFWYIAEQEVFSSFWVQTYSTRNIQFSSLFSYMLWHIEGVVFFLLYYRSSSSVVNLHQVLYELCPFWNLEYWKYTVFRTFLLNALTYWAEILYMYMTFI